MASLSNQQKQQLQRLTARRRELLLLNYQKAQAQATIHAFDYVLRRDLDSHYPFIHDFEYYLEARKFLQSHPQLIALATTRIEHLEGQFEA